MFPWFVIEIDVSGGTTDEPTAIYSLLKQTTFTAILPAEKKGGRHRLQVWGDNRDVIDHANETYLPCRFTEAGKARV